jgi:gliding motility-associated-like protein
MINGVSVSTEFEPILVFNYGETADVMLVTTSLDGCKDRTSKIIIGSSFDELLEIEIPNVFTPNGDGINDYFEIKSNGDLSACIQLTIFNRNGIIAYQSKGGIHSWNGRSNTGKKFSDGVYYYLIEINGVEYKGNLTLLGGN